jgi:hypothetical protein
MSVVGGRADVIRQKADVPSRRKISKIFFCVERPSGTAQTAALESQRTSPPYLREITTPSTMDELAKAVEDMNERLEDRRK